MTTDIINEQDKLAVGDELTDVIRNAVRAAAKVGEFGEKIEVSVMLTDNEGIRELNREHRGIDRATDVLSFPLLEFSEDKRALPETVDFGENEEVTLGDIVISLERAAEQAEEYGHSMKREVGFLTVHSMLHLYGYDHMTEDDEREMFALQEKILDGMGLKREKEEL